MPPVYALDANETDQVPNASCIQTELSGIVLIESCGTYQGSDTRLTSGAPLIRILGIMQIPDDNVWVPGSSSARIRRRFIGWYVVYRAHD